MAKTDRLNIRLDPDVAEWIESIAGKRRCSASQVAREFIQDAMNREAGADAPTRSATAASRRAGRIAAEAKRRKKAA